MNLRQNLLLLLIFHNNYFNNFHQGRWRHLRGLDESVGVGGAEGPATCSRNWGQTGADGSDIDDEVDNNDDINNEDDNDDEW